MLSVFHSMWTYTHSVLQLIILFCYIQTVQFFTTTVISAGKISERKMQNSKSLKKLYCQIAFLWGGAPGQAHCDAGHPWYPGSRSNATLRGAAPDVLPSLSDLQGAVCRCYTGPPAGVIGKSLAFAFLEPSPSWCLHSCLLSCWLLCGLEWRRKMLGKLLLSMFNLLPACWVPLCSSSRQLPSCLGLLLSTAGGPCL